MRVCQTLLIAIAERIRPGTAKPRLMALAMPALAILAPLAIMGCGSDQETPLPGERLPLLVYADLPSVDAGTESRGITLPPARVNESWSQLRASARHNPQHLAIGDAPLPLWSAGLDVAYGLRPTPTPVIAEGRLYALDAAGGLYSFDAATGAALWQRDLVDESVSGGGIAIEGGVVYVVLSAGIVMAVRAENGEEVWRQEINSLLRNAPAVADGRLFVSDVDNNLYAIDLAEGQILWINAGAGRPATPIAITAPAISGSLVVVPSSVGDVRAFRVENGRLLWGDTLTTTGWSGEAEDIAALIATPVIDDQLIFVGGRNARFVALNANTGRRAWAQGVALSAMPWSAGDVIYALTRDHALICFAREDGLVHWIHSLASYQDMEAREDPIQWFAPVLAGERLLLTSSTGIVRMISPYDGTVMGDLDLGEALVSAPVIADETLYFVTASGQIVALR